MATYNGQNFIEEQLLSICSQTIKPDEIIISDDGSKDSTIEIVKKVSGSDEAQGIKFVIITDNPRHGYCGNFEWAIKHASGDYVFLSDQDDVWMPEKVVEILKVYSKHSDAECVCHNAVLIDKNSERIEGIFDDRFCEDKLNVPVGESVKIDRKTYLEHSVSWGGLHGMSLCLTRKLINDIFPFPKGNGFHDKWITFCSVLNDSLYYVNSSLCLYRLHGSNTCGNSAYRGNVLDKMRRRVKNLRNKTGYYADYYFMGYAIKERLEERNYTDHIAYTIANRLVEIGEKTKDAETSGRITGAIKLCKLFCTDMRYRRSGTGGFLQELLYIILHSKKERLQNIM